MEPPHQRVLIDVVVVGEAGNLHAQSGLDLHGQIHLGLAVDAQIDGLAASKRLVPTQESDA